MVILHMFSLPYFDGLRGPTNVLDNKCQTFHMHNQHFCYSIRKNYLLRCVVRVFSKSINQFFLFLQIYLYLEAFTATVETYLAVVNYFKCIHPV